MAQWNYSRDGATWPHKTKAALLDAPPGLHGGQPPKKAKKVKQTALFKAVQEHWDKLPEGLRSECEALGVPRRSLHLHRTFRPSSKSICRVFRKTSRLQLRRLLNQRSPSLPWPRSSSNPLEPTATVRSKICNSGQSRCCEESIHFSSTRAQGVAGQD